MQMIDKCEQRIDSYRKTIAYYERVPVLGNTLDYYYNRWSVTLGIKERLLKAYTRSVAKIVVPELV